MLWRSPYTSTVAKRRSLKPGSLESFTSSKATSLLRLRRVPAPSRMPSSRSPLIRTAVLLDLFYLSGAAPRTSVQAMVPSLFSRTSRIHSSAHNWCSISLAGSMLAGPPMMYVLYFICHASSAIRRRSDEDQQAVLKSFIS